jgi:uridine kinase
MDLKIFVLTDDDIRLARRIQRDIKPADEGGRGRDISDVLNQYNKFVKASYDEFIKPTMKYADIIVPHGRSNTIAIDFIISNLKNIMPDEALSSAIPHYRTAQNENEAEDEFPVLTNQKNLSSYKYNKLKPAN